MTDEKKKKNRSIETMFALKNDVDNNSSCSNAIMYLHWQNWVSCPSKICKKGHPKIIDLGLTLVWFYPQSGGNWGNLT